MPTRRWRGTLWNIYTNKLKQQKNSKTMTRERAKQILPLLQAYTEGKTIQIKTDDGWKDLNEPSFAEPFDSLYRVKPEPKYRPFASKAECWNEMLKHQPFGWVRNKYDGEYGRYILIDSIEENGVRHGSSSSIFEEPFKQCTFPDGAPFGVIEE